MRNETHAWPSADLPPELEPEFRIAQETGVEFLDIELQLAETFLDFAKTTGNVAARRRNLSNTRKALEAVEHFIGRLSQELPQRQLLALRARELRWRLCDTELHLRSRGHSE
jgi:hypothetical protein